MFTDEQLALTIVAACRARISEMRRTSTPDCNCDKCSFCVLEIKKCDEIIARIGNGERLTVPPPF
jgi:hypothetical protein